MHCKNPYPIANHENPVKKVSTPNLKQLAQTSKIMSFCRCFLTPHSSSGLKPEELRIESTHDEIPATHPVRLHGFLSYSVPTVDRAGDFLRGRVLREGEIWFLASELDALPVRFELYVNGFRFEVLEQSSAGLGGDDSTAYSDFVQISSSAYREFLSLEQTVGKPF